MRRVILWVVLALAGALVLPHAVRAQGPGVMMDARALYEGTSKYGEWLPVVVELENSGGDVSGEVQVRVTSSGSETTYAQRVELPRGARKQVTIYTVPNNFSRRLVVDFVQATGAEPLVSDQVDVRPVPNIRFMLASITGGGDGLAPVAGLNFRGERGPRDQAVVVPLTLETLPDRPEALRTLDLIVISGQDTSSLTPRQQSALEQYVAMGGMLVLGGGPEANRVIAGIPETLRPVAPAGEARLDSLATLEEITGEPVRVQGPFVAARGEPASGTNVRYGMDDLPLLVEREVGSGIVYWLALDPALTPFDAWAGTDEFWHALVGSRATYPLDMPPDVSQRQMVNQQLFYALQSLPSLDLPSLRLLVPLLAAYILIVGPVNYFVLRRGRRMEFAWVTIPLITILFSAGAYGLGFQLRGSDVIINQVAVVQGVPGSEGGYARSAIGIFSPSRRTYNMEIRGGALVAPAQMEGDPFSGSGRGSGAPVLLQGEPSQVQNLVVNQWSMQGVMVESLVTEGYGFEATLYTSDDTVTGSVTNNSDYLWKDVVIVLGQSFARLGDIAPGESKEVSLPMRDLDPRAMGDIAWRIFEGQMGNDPRQRELQARQQVINGLFSGPYGSTPLAASRKPVLLAWVDATPADVGLIGEARAARVGTTLFYSEVPVRYGEGRVSLPRGMIQTRLLQSDGGTCYGPSIASLAPDFSEAEIQFELPAELRGIDLEQLTLYVTSDGGWFEAPKLLLYDFSREGWDEIPDAILGRNRVNEPDAYLSPGGQMRLRLENQNRNRGGCLFLDAAVAGNLPARVGALQR